MSRKASFLLLLFALLAVGRSDAEALSPASQLEAYLREFGSLEALRVKYAEAVQEQKPAVEALKGDIAKFREDENAVVAAMWEQKAKLEAHDQRCTGTFQDQNFVEDCNSEKLRLDATSGELNNAHSALDGRRTRLDATRQKLKDEKDGLVAADAKARGRMVELQGLAKPLIDALKAAHAECGPAIDAASKDPGLYTAMHAACEP